MAVEFAVVTGVLPTADAAYTDFTKSGFGTPTAAIIFTSAHGIETGTVAQTGIGFWTSSVQNAIGAGQQDAVAVANTWRVGSDANVVILPTIDTGAVQIRCDASAITDGLRITKRQGTTSIQRYTTVILIKGVTNVQAGVHDFTTGGSTSEISTAFKADLVLFASNSEPKSAIDAETTGQAAAVLHFGAAHVDSSEVVTQGMVGFGDQDAASTMIVNTVTRDDKVIQQAYADSLTSFYASVTGTDANSINLSYACTSFNRAAIYLALELPDPDDAFVGVVNSKTTTGTQAYTGTGFTPTALLLATAGDTAINTINTTPIGAFTLGATDGTTSRSVCSWSDDATADSRTGSYSGLSNALACYNSDESGNLIVADHSSFDSNGFTLNWTTADATARKVLAIAVGNSAGGGTTTLTLNQIAETDSAQPVTAAKYLAIGQASTADTAQIITPVLVAGQITVALNSASETDLAQLVGKVKRKPTGQTAETDVAQIITNSKHKAIGQSAESDIAQPAAKVKRKAFSQTSEAEVAQPITFLGTKTVILVQNTEADEAQAFTRFKLRALGFPTEVESVSSITARKIKALAPATETDEAQPVGVVATQYVALNTAYEVDEAQRIVDPNAPVSDTRGGGWYAPAFKEQDKAKNKPRKVVEEKKPKQVKESLAEVLAEPEKRQATSPVAPVAKVLKPEPVKVTSEPTVEEHVTKALSTTVLRQEQDILALQQEVAELKAMVVAMQGYLSARQDEEDAMLLINLTLGGV